MYQQLRLEPYAVHTTFQYAGTEGKRHRLREAMVFYDPPEYYNPPGNFLLILPQFRYAYHSILPCINVQIHIFDYLSTVPCILYWEISFLSSVGASVTVMLKTES